MTNVVSIASKIEKRNRLKQEIRNRGLTSLTEAFNQLTSEKKILDCDGRIDADGRAYRGRCKKEEIFLELDHLKSVGVYGIKHYNAYNTQGIIVPTHFAIFGRDKQQNTDEIFLR